jgi:SpoVK/Ycf46/Vps4 family AAA+-type ATPase
MPPATAPAGFATAGEHLLAELGRLELLVKRQVYRLRAANLLTEDEFRGLYIADAQVDALLGAGQVEGAASLRALDGLIDRARAEIDERTRCTGPDARPPLARLAERFGLSPFETDLLLVAVAPELDLRWETLYAYVQNDVTRRRPTVDLALKLLCADLEERLRRRSRLAHDAPLLRHGLLRLVDDPQERAPPLPARFLKVDERVVAFLLGQDRLPAELAAFTRVPPPARRLDRLALPGEVRRRLADAAAGLRRDAVVLLKGPPGAGKQAVAEALAAQAEVPLVTVDLDLALAAEADGRTLGTLVRREAVLRQAALCLTHAEALLARDPPARRQATAFLAELHAHPLPILLAGTAGWDHELPAFGDRLLTFELAPPEAAERRQLWREAVGDTGPDVRGVADRFALSARQVAAAAAEARKLAALRPPGEATLTEQDLLAAARSQSSRALHGLAQKVEPVYTWADIVLPPRPLTALRQVCASVTQRHTVHSKWGFERKLAYGKGLSALFAGPSGTGKTMAAQIVAHDLGMELYKIDLSSVVSKYIGETEQNLRRIFRAAESSNAVLFFDEADALFGKRSEVRDAHDRYANIEVAYLLQQLEEYEGLVVLATNLSRNLDDAFTRRMEHAVEFPMPDQAHRERIWRGMFPPRAPLAGDVDLAFLARQFPFAGGGIRSVALAAAFQAAAEASPIRMAHLMRATARELEKLGRLPSRAEFREYYDLLLEEATPS